MPGGWQVMPAARADSAQPGRHRLHVSLRARAAIAGRISRRVSGAPRMFSVRYPYPAALMRRDRAVLRRLALADPA